MTFEELVRRVVSARLSNDHALVSYYLDELQRIGEVWSAKHIFEELANAAEGVHRDSVL